MAEFGIAGLNVQVLGYQFPGQDDYWDGNWLVVDIRCESANAQLAFRDSCVRTDELKDFLRQLEALVNFEAKAATLNTMEPYFKVNVMRDQSKNGIHSAAVEFFQIQNQDKREFVFEIQQAELARIIQRLRGVVTKFPVRGQNDS